jgi:hypothetical protein
MIDCVNMTTHSKVAFYVLPEELRRKTVLSREEVQAFEVTEKELHGRVGLIVEDCHVSGHSTITCQCGDPPKPKNGQCDGFSTPEGVYCFTRCPSCFTICA